MVLKACATLLCVTVLVGCSSSSDPVAESGEQLYSQHCAECHKASGKGNFIQGIPANKNTELDKKGLVTLITKGMASHPQMPMFNHLTEEQADQIANHLLSMGKRG